jgi:two-component system response regulator MprA
LYRQTNGSHWLYNQVVHLKVRFLNGSGMPRILVIEDEPEIADLVKRGLALKGFEVEVAYTGNQGLETALSSYPDLVVLDLMLPDADGVDICRELRASGDMGIVILTARTVVGERVRGLEAGADDYLPKPFAFEELLARIRAVLRRRSPQTGGVMQVGDLKIDIEKRQVHRGNRVLELTNREFELLKLLVQYAGRPLSREYIIQRVWGYEFEGETDPVKVYINFLRHKLNAGGEKDLIHAVHGFGYSLEDK